MSLSITPTLKTVATLSKDLELATQNLTLPIGGDTTKLTDGTGANQVDKLHTDVATIAASGSQDYDLDGGLVDGFGDSQTFTAVKLLVVRNTSATAEINVGGNFLFSTDNTPTIPPGGELYLKLPSAAGETVTAATKDTITINNEDGANAATIEIMIAGI